MRQSPDAVMLFAAGFGTRMRHLTKDRPKPLVPVAGRPLIDHALDLLQAVKPRVTVANLHYKADMLEAHLGPLGVRTRVEQPDILDTGGGLHNALPDLGQGPVFTLNSDAIWVGPNPLLDLAAAWEPERMDALLTCVPLENTRGYTRAGDFELDASGRISRGSKWVYGGAQIIKTDLLETVSQKIFSLNVIWDMMQENGTLFGLAYPGLWCDIGHPGGIPIAEEMLENADV